MSAIIQPPPERLRRGEVLATAIQVVDEKGGIGCPFRTVETLTRMHARKTISMTMRIAGERFHELFVRAHAMSLRAADITRPPAAGAQPRQPSWPAARDDLHEVVLVLGGHRTLPASCAWGVLGELKTLEEWRATGSWNRGPVSPSVASGVLMATLSTLEHHFGLTPD